MLALFIVVPLLALVALNLPLMKASARAAFGLGIAVSVAQMLLAILQPQWALGGKGPLDSLLWFPMAADALSIMLLMLIGLISFISILVARATLTDARQRYNFVNVLLIVLIGMNGMSLSTDLFSLYVFLEVTAVASFILIALQRSKESLEGTFKYIILSAVASILMVSAIALLLLTSGDTSFSAVAAGVKGSPVHVFTTIAIGLFLCGLFIKGGLVPFHGWVVGAYSTAPTATAVLLAGIVSKVAIYALIRLVISVFGFGNGVNQVLLLVGAISAVVGALAALNQSDMKRLLAYSSISQVGYIVLALGCGTYLGILGAVFHFFNHAIFKSLLFVNSAAVEQRIGTTDMTKMGGLGGRMPWTGITATLGMLSTAGIPPLAGFWSKLIIIIALWQAGLVAYAIIAILISVLTLAYMLSMQRKVFFGQLREGFQEVREARMGLLVPAIILAAITLATGIIVPVGGFVLKTLENVATVFPLHGGLP